MSSFFAWSVDKQVYERRQEQTVTVVSLPQTSVIAVCTHGVVTEELFRIKAGLRRTETRVAPKKYASRIPHIEEMAKLARQYKKEQRQLKHATTAAAALRVQNDEETAENDDSKNETF